MPGLGTVANAIVIGVVTDAVLAVLVTPDAFAGRLGLLVGGIVLNGLATALYIGSQLGPGPRDGLMTGLVRRTGWSVRLVRTSIELSVVAVGWLLGGVVGVGTVLYALVHRPARPGDAAVLHRRAARVRGTGSRPAALLVRAGPTGCDEARCRSVTAKTAMITASDRSVGISGTCSQRRCAQCRPSLVPMNARITASP